MLNLGQNYRHRPTMQNSHLPNPNDEFLPRPDPPSGERWFRVRENRDDLENILTPRYRWRSESKNLALQRLFVQKQRCHHPAQFWRSFFPKRYYHRDALRQKDASNEKHLDESCFLIPREDAVEFGWNS